MILIEENKTRCIEIKTINNKFGSLDVEDDEYPGNTFNHIGILDVQLLPIRTRSC